MSETISADERREFTRVRINLEVEVNSDDKTSISGVAQDLSLNGCYFPCTGRLPEGTPCKIEVFLDNREIKIEVHGKVSRVTGDGMAVEFTGVPLDDLEHLRNLIRFNADDPNAVQEEFDAHVGLKPKGTDE